MPRLYGLPPGSDLSAKLTGDPGAMRRHVRASYSSEEPDSLREPGFGATTFTIMSAGSVANVIVLAPDLPDVALMAEVKTVPGDRTLAEEQLKRYMLGRRCPVFLLVTPVTTWIYRDSYRGYSEGAIDLVADVPTEELLGAPAAVGVDLERQVFDWLERLASSWPSALPTNEKARAAVVEHLVPAVVDGRVVLQSRAA